jgi:DNA-nicking Smr family endonuclease
MESRRHRCLTEADRALWASYAGRVTPLASRANPSAGPKPAAPPPTPPAPAAGQHIGGAPIAPLTIGTQPGGIDTANWQRFRTGRLRVTRTLDLHGHTAQRAFLALASFLRSAQAEGLRCVEVVTGQGSVLRRELPLWLNLPEFRSLVLAAAHPHPANPGSVRLLLRRPGARRQR